jgi:hypothetical protein
VTHIAMHYVLKTSSAHIVNLHTYSKAVSGSNFGYAVCPVLWERYLACRIHFGFVSHQWKGLVAVDVKALPLMY